MVPWELCQFASKVSLCNFGHHQNFGGTSYCLHHFHQVCKMLSLHVTYSSWVGSPHVSSSPIKYKLASRGHYQTIRSRDPRKPFGPAHLKPGVLGPRPVPRPFPHRRPRPGSRCLSPFCDPASLASVQSQRLPLVWAC